jgi:hypothetical protein
MKYTTILLFLVVAIVLHTTNAAKDTTTDDKHMSCQGLVISFQSCDGHRCCADVFSLIACRQVVKSVQEQSSSKISKSTPAAKKRTAVTK